LDGGDETVSAAGERLYIAWTGGGIAEGFPYFIDRGIQAVIEVDEGVGGPEALLDLFAGDDFSGSFEEQGEDLEGLSLEAELDAALPQFARAEIEFENSETGDAAVRRERHGRRASLAL
jgi:hypothetical protein